MQTNWHKVNEENSVWYFVMPLFQMFQIYFYIFYFTFARLILYLMSYYWQIIFLQHSQTDLYFIVVLPGFGESVYFAKKE